MSDALSSTPLNKKRWWISAQRRGTQSASDFMQIQLDKNMTGCSFSGNNALSLAFLTLNMQIWKMNHLENMF